MKALSIYDLDELEDRKPTSATMTRSASCTVAARIEVR